MKRASRPELRACLLWYSVGWLTGWLTALTWSQPTGLLRLTKSKSLSCIFSTVNYDELISYSTNWSGINRFVEGTQKNFQKNIAYFQLPCCQLELTQPKANTKSYITEVHVHIPHAQTNKSIGESLQISWPYHNVQTKQLVIKFYYLFFVIRAECRQGIRFRYKLTDGQTDL